MVRLLVSEGFYYFFCFLLGDTVYYFPNDVGYFSGVRFLSSKVLYD